MIASLRCVNATLASDRRRAPPRKPRSDEPLEGRFEAPEAPTPATELPEPQLPETD